MSWTTSDRRSRLPSNWTTLVKIVKQRAGGRCEGVDHGIRCTVQGSDCDHIVPGDDHRLSNLQWLCRDHHKIKTARESRAARARLRSERHRPAASHPGLR